jgi:Holliday junction resolvasome RuvABC endonuclease subunit
LDLQTGQRTLIDVRTFDAARSLVHYRSAVAVHGERVARLLAHEHGLASYFSVFRPHAIASEAPYLGRFPQAYAALVECVSAIRRAVMTYDAYMPLHVVDPMTVKAAVGVVSKGRKKSDALSKENVRAAVMGLGLNNPGQIDLEALDEHSIDAIAVACSRVLVMYQP